MPADRPIASLSEREHRVVGAANARTSWRTRRAVRVALSWPGRDAAFDGRSWAGATGFGEAAPLPGYSLDDLPTVRRALERWAVAPPVVDIDDPLGSVRRAVDVLPVDVPSARFAVETAVLDLVGRLRGEPMHELLGARDPEPLPLAGLVTGLGDDALETAARLVERGLRTLKVKISREGRLGDELSTLERLRARRPDVGLRLDANGALSPDRLDELLAAFARVEPELVEEPAPLDALRVLRAPPVPIALDESLRRLVVGRSSEAPEVPSEVPSEVPGTSRDVLLEVPGTPWDCTTWDWLASARCVAVVLKPGVLGGVLACLDIARAASTTEVDGRPVAAIASHLFDGPIGLQATAAMALALEHPLAAGLDRSYLLDEADFEHDTVPLVGPSTLRPDRARPGLGLDVLHA